MVQVKEYCERQWAKILSGRVSLADFVFAKEVRLGTYAARGGIVPPAAIVAGKAMAADPRAEPRYGERVPYVVVHGEPGGLPSGLEQQCFPQTCFMMVLVPSPVCSSTWVASPVYCTAALCTCLQ